MRVHVYIHVYTVSFIMSCPTHIIIKLLLLFTRANKNAQLYNSFTLLYVIMRGPTIGHVRGPTIGHVRGPTIGHVLGPTIGQNSYQNFCECYININIVVPTQVEINAR